jgi:hypothetical protein
MSWPAFNNSSSPAAIRTGTLPGADRNRFTRLRDYGPVETFPPVPSFPELLVLFSGGLLLPGLPVALGAIRSSSSSTFRRISLFISFTSFLFEDARIKNQREPVLGVGK